MLGMGFIVMRFVRDVSSPSIMKQAPYSGMEEEALTIHAVLKTNMTQNLQSDPQMYERMNELHPFGGMGEVQDVARAAVFLASDDARWVTGVPLPVDGGYLLM